MQADVASLAVRLQVIEARFGLCEKVMEARLGLFEPSQPNPKQLGEASENEQELPPAMRISDSPEQLCSIFEQPGGLQQKVEQPPEEELTEAYFESSAWSVPLLIGLADVGWFDHAFAVVLVLLNLFMQTAFTGVLLSDGFMGESLDEEIESATIWRTSVAHDARCVACTTAGLGSLSPASRPYIPERTSELFAHRWAC